MNRKHSIAIMAFLFMAGSALSAQEMKTVSLHNQDLKMESNGAPKYWIAANRDWPGMIKLGKDADGSRFVSLTPLPSPTQKDSAGKPQKMAQITQETYFLGGCGRNLRISFQFRIYDPASGVMSSSCVIRGKASSAKSTTYFPSLKLAPAKAGVWTKYVYTKKMSDKLLPEEQCNLEFNVYGGKLDVKDLKVELEAPKK